MIQAISFMGKEGCIEPAKKVGKKAAEYFGKEPIGEIKKAEKVAKDAVRKADELSYKISHGNEIPAAEDLNKKVAADIYTKNIQPGIPLN